MLLFISEWWTDWRRDPVLAVPDVTHILAVSEPAPEPGVAHTAQQYTVWPDRSFHAVAVCLIYRCARSARCV